MCFAVLSNTQHTVFDNITKCEDQKLAQFSQRILDESEENIFSLLKASSHPLQLMTSLYLFRRSKAYSLRVFPVLTFAR